MQNYKRNYCANFQFFLKCRLITIVRRLFLPPRFHDFAKMPDKVYKLAKKPLPDKSVDKNLTQEFPAALVWENQLTHCLHLVLFKNNVLMTHFSLQPKKMEYILSQ